MRFHFHKFQLIFQAVTGHWIDDDWVLHEALLDFLHIEGHHYGEILGEKVFEILEEYEICEKLFCITADNAGNNGIMCIVLSILLKNIGIEWDPKKYQISCMNHVINLTVQEFIKSIKVIIDNKDDEIEKELQEGEDKIFAIGFAKAMYKIRTIMKVQSKIID